MMPKKNLVRMLALVALCGLSGVARGGVIARFDVTNYSDNNGDLGNHGLWTQNYPSEKFFGVVSGTFSRFSDKNSFSDVDQWAELNFTAVNKDGMAAVVDLDLSDWSDTLNAPFTYKKEDGLASPDNALQDFYGAVEGTIRFYDDLALAGAGGLPSVSVEIGQFVGSHTFQFGFGANSKSKTEFGGSAWIQTKSDGIFGIKDGSSVEQKLTHHWDINVAFAGKTIGPAAGGNVPEPSSMALWAGVMGLMGVGRRRSRVSK